MKRDEFDKLKAEVVSLMKAGMPAPLGTQLSKSWADTAEAAYVENPESVRELLQQQLRTLRASATKAREAKEEEERVNRDISRGRLATREELDAILKPRDFEVGDYVRWKPGHWQGNDFFPIDGKAVVTGFTIFMVEGKEEVTTAARDTLVGVLMPCSNPDCPVPMHLLELHFDGRRLEKAPDPTTTPEAPPEKTEP